MIFEERRMLLASNRFIQYIHGLPSEIKNNTIILIGPMEKLLTKEIIKNY